MSASGMASPLSRPERSGASMRLEGRSRATAGTAQKSSTRRGYHTRAERGRVFVPRRDKLGAPFLSLTAAAGRQPHQSRLARDSSQPDVHLDAARPALRARQIGVRHDATQSEQRSGWAAAVPGLSASTDESSAPADRDEERIDDVRLYPRRSMQHRHEPDQDGYVGGGLMVV
jgi:hypothetical protein